MKKRVIPPAVSYRIGFTPLDLEVDMFFPQLHALCPSADEQQVRKWLSAFGGRLLRHIQTVLGKAAAAGIDQAIDIILDPEYYEHRLQRDRRRNKEWSAKRQLERQELERRKREPTAEDIERHRQYIENQIAWHRSSLEKYLKELANIQQPPLETMKPAGRLA